MIPSTIVSNGPIEPIAERLLEPFGKITIAPNSSDEALFPLLKSAIGVILRGEGRFSEQAFSAAPNLKVVARSGVGYENVDVRAATARRIPVVYTPGAGARAVAEAAMAWILALSKRVVYWDQQFKAGNWNCRFQTKGGDLEGATLGIVGFGRIGQQLARLATPFDMQILAYDPYVAADVFAGLGVTHVDLDELMRRADYISIHAAATLENRGLINRRCVELVRPGTFLVNLARGSLIDSLDVLHEALVDGRLAGVGLDVFDPEPPSTDHPIFRHPNCLTAPHSLANTRRAMSKIFESMARDMAAVLRGDKPQFVVNPEVLEDAALDTA
jgi:phosphoglycerate dehydrogenase-like enzyme